MKNHKYYQRRNRYKQNNDRQSNFGGGNRQVYDISNGINFKRQNINKNINNISIPSMLKKNFVLGEPGENSSMTPIVIIKT